MSDKSPFFVLSVDIGTTGCKTMAVDRAGCILAEGEAWYPINSPRPGWGEQDLAAVVAGVITSVRQCLAQTHGAPAALCVGGALHSIAAVGRQDSPLMPALTWADTRSEKQAAALRGCSDLHALYQRTGCPMHAIYPLAKIRWLQECQPETFEAATRFVSIKEFVVHMLTGQWVVDDSLASGSGLLNIHAHDWDEGALAMAGIGRERLSPVVAARTDIGGLTPAAARDLGAPAGTPVIVGASDAALSSLGAGAVAPHVFTVMVGSSGAVRLLTGRPLLDDHERTWCYILDRSHYLAGGAINNAGLVLRWFADRFLGTVAGDAYELLIGEAAQVGPGAAGLVMLPFLAGERSPGWNAQARGVLFGLSLHHDRRHVARAILEAVAYRLRSVFEVLEQVAGRAVEIRASGGFLRSPLWVHILADVLGRPIGVPGTANTSALGAALLGWHALGEIGDLQEVADLVPVAHVIQPDAEHHHVYSRLYRLYGDLYNQLDAAFAEISDIQATAE
jgi:gluconokinase